MRKKCASYSILSMALLSSLLMAASLAARQAAKPWVTYTPPAKNFTALFPTAPSPDHQTINDGGLINEVYSYISSENRVIFFVNCMTLNPKATTSPDAALKSAQDGLLQMGGAKLLTSTKTEYIRGPNDRLTMLEFTGATDATSIKGRAIFDTDQMYTLGTFCPKGQDCSSSTAKFFSSFKLNPAKPAKPIPAPAPKP